MNNIENIKDFAAVVMESIKDYLPADMQDCRIEVRETVKPNITYTSLLIHRPDCNITPCFHLDGLYREYLNGAKMPDILAKLAIERMKYDRKENFTADQFYRFEDCKDKIVPRLINASKNQQYLESHAHVLIHDLACVFYVLIEGFAEWGGGAIGVTNEIMEKWNVTASELHETAVNNLPSLQPPVFTDVVTVLAKTSGISEEEQKMMRMSLCENMIYVLTNTNNLYGASAVFDKKIMKELVEKFGDFYILPSSIHEVIIAPVKPDMDVDYLKEMVTEINATHLEPDEVLSDSIYTYTLEGGLKKVS